MQHEGHIYANHRLALSDMRTLRRTHLAVVAALATVCPHTVYAESTYVTGRDLLSQCTTRTLEALANCTNYVKGVADAYSDPLLDEKVERLKVCIPSGTRLGDVIGPIIAYLKDSQTELDTKASHLVAVVLAAHFRCR